MHLLDKARQKANELIEEMEPFCERIMIAGSIRRGKAEVKDLEIIAIPEFVIVEEPTDNLFEPHKEVLTNTLWTWAMTTEEVSWIKPGTSEIIEWKPKPEGKYWRGLVHIESQPVKLDLFLLNRQNWGVLATIRTGPAHFSEAVVTFIKHRTPFRVSQGHLTIEETGEIIPCAEEADFFANAGIEFVFVQDREDANPYRFLKLKL